MTKRRGRAGAAEEIPTHTKALKQNAFEPNATTINDIKTEGDVVMKTAFSLTINSPWRKLDAPKKVSISKLIIEETEKYKLEQHVKSHDVVVFSQYNKFYDPFIYFSVFDSIPNPFRWIRDKLILNDIFYIVSSYLTQRDTENLFNALIPDTLQPYEECDNIIGDKFSVYEDDFSPMTLHNKLISDEIAKEYKAKFEKENDEYEEYMDKRNMILDLYRRFGENYLMGVERLTESDIYRYLYSNSRYGNSNYRVM